jgi:hypothetical protein
MKSISVRYLPPDPVKIVGMDGYKGTVVGIKLDINNLLYNIQYWYNGEVRYVYLVENEITEG